MMFYEIDLDYFKMMFKPNDITHLIHDKVNSTLIIKSKDEDIIITSDLEYVKDKRNKISFNNDTYSLLPNDIAKVYGLINSVLIHCNSTRFNPE